MTPLTIDHLQKTLKRLKYDAQLQEETNQLYVILKIQQIEFPIFLRIYPSEDLLQFLVFMPVQVSPERQMGFLGRGGGHQDCHQ